MDASTIGLVAIAVISFAAVSRKAERSAVTPPLFFMGVGLLTSSAGLGWLELDVDGTAMHILAELTLVLVLFTDAARIDLRCLLREASIPARMLLIGMPACIGVGAVVAVGLFPSLSVFEALLLASILAPTDAALGQSVVTNPTIPLRIRQSLNVESGLNDGIALPIVLVFAGMAGAHAQASAAADAFPTALLAITLGPLVGAAVGYVGGRGVTWGTTSGWISAAFQRILGPALALFAFSAAEWIGGNGFISAFVAGLTLGNTARDVCGGLYEFGEAEGQLLTLLVFLAFGATMVPAALSSIRGDLVLYVLASLTFVRMVPVAVSLIGSGLQPASVAFLGWFGPRGLASILFALLVVEDGSLDSGQFLLSAVTLTVFASTILHGISAYPVARRYGAYTSGMTSSHPEHAEAMDLPVRISHTIHGARVAAPADDATAGISTSRRGADGPPR